MVCSQCGRAIPDKSKFCSFCGAPVEAAGQPIQPAPLLQVQVPIPPKRIPEDRLRQNTPEGPQSSGQQPQGPGQQTQGPGQQLPPRQQPAPGQTPPPEWQQTDSVPISAEKKQSRRLWVIAVASCLVALVSLGAAAYFYFSSRDDRDRSEDPALAASETLPELASRSEASAAETESVSTEAPSAESPVTEPAAVTTAEPVPETTEPEPPQTEPEDDGRADTLVVGTSDFSQKFSPFYYTTVYDGYIGADLTQVSLLGSDREGNPILNGIKGEVRPYNGTDYTYYGIADCIITENSDGTVDYRFTIRDDVRFSDGELLTMDDVLFSLYLISDPTYDGSSTFYSLPIEGMEAYRSGMETRGNVIYEAGDSGYSSNSLYTKEQYDAFWSYYNNRAGAEFAQEIIDYCLSNYLSYSESYIGATADEVLADKGLQIKLGMYLWGFGDYWFKGADAADFWAAIVDTYQGDTETAESIESAGSTRLQLTLAALGEEYRVGVEAGASAPSISGITKLSDTEFNIRMTRGDATAIYHISAFIAPLHYYGDPALFNGVDSFGFHKGDLQLSRTAAKLTRPLGAGPYTFVDYSNGRVTMKANPYYWKGKPKTEYIVFQETSSADMLTGIYTGDVDLTNDASFNSTTYSIVKGYNSSGALNGDIYTTITSDNLGYGYIGINASLVNVNGDPGSEASKNLRKAYATVFAVYRDACVASYYGELAQVINYPISNSSWAAPRPADAGYEVAFSRDVNGNPIYSPGMLEQERYAAALQASLGFFEAAGFPVSNGRVQGVPALTVVVPGLGTGDHPAYRILTEASAALASIGVDLEVYDVSDNNILWDGLDANTIAMWAAAWGSAVDPDLYQVYHSDNITGHGTGSNHYMITSSKLDQLIMDARTSVDQSYRKAVYKQCLDEILDWAVEVPNYQRQNATFVSTQRVDLGTLTPDITPFWSWINDIEKLRMN